MSGLLPELKAAHDGLLALVAPEADPVDKALSEQAAADDLRFDALARSIHDVLTALSVLEDDGVQYLALRDKLFPNGLAAVVQQTYRGEAGTVKLLRETITEAQRQALAAIPLPTETLLARVDAWLATGERLGELEDQRARRAPTRVASTPAQLFAARNLWVRTVNALVAIAELAPLDADTMQTIFGPLNDAEATADARAARRRARPEADEAAPAASDA